jgi:hypothetical protein
MNKVQILKFVNVKEGIIKQSEMQCKETECCFVLFSVWT